MRPQRTRQGGVALIELALALPMLLMMMVVVTEFGRAYYQYNVLAKSVREAARYLSVRAKNVGVANAKNIIVYGNPGGSGSPRLPGLSLSNAPDPVWTTNGSYPVITTVTVSVSGYTFRPMVGSVFGLNLSTITFSPIRATMRSPS